MATQDAIDLIDELSNKQKNNDFVILTTFCFDPYFFDNILLQKIRSNNPLAEIIVLIDGGQYQKSLERFTNQTGRQYQLVPIYLNKGVFHPKLFTFISKQKQKTTVFVGSSNITVPGLTKNAELVMKIEYSKEYLDSNLSAIKGFYEKLIEREFLRDKKAITIIREAIDQIPINNEKKSEFSFLHNIESPLISQLLEIVPSDSYQELFLFAPFYSPNLELFKPIFEKYKIDKVRIGIQENNHNINDPGPFIAFCNNMNLSYEFNHISYIGDDDRIFHSKIIHFQGDTSYMLIGSPNITYHALYYPANRGNIECATLFTSRAIPELIQKISRETIPDPQKVNVIDYVDDDPTIQPLRIYSLEFDDITKTLHGTTEAHPGPVTAHLFFEAKQPQEIPIDLREGKFSIRSLDGIPYEIEIKSPNKSGRRRIYYDTGAFIRNISRANFSFREISSRRSQLSNTDMLTFLLGTLKRIDDETPDAQKGSDQEEKEGRKKSRNILKPSKIPSATSLQSSIRYIDRLNYTFRINRQKERFRNNTGIEERDDDENTNIREMETTTYTRDDEKYVDKWIIKIHDVLSHSLSLSNDPDLTNECVFMESSFLDFILRFFVQLITPRQIDIIENKLKEKLETIDQRDISTESAVDLFKNVLKLNYCRDLQYHPSICGKTISYEGLLVPENYLRVKRSIEDFLEQQNIEHTELDLKNFHSQFASLIQFCFNPSTISNGPINIVEKIITTDNTELREFYGETLRRIKCGPWDYQRSIYSWDILVKKLISYVEGQNIQTASINKHVKDLLCD